MAFGVRHRSHCRYNLEDTVNKKLEKKPPLPRIPAVAVYLSDKHWPRLSMLIVTDTGEEIERESLYDTAATNFEPAITSAFRKNIEALKGLPR